MLKKRVERRALWGARWEGGTEILSPTNEQYEAHSSGARWGPREGT